MHTVTKFLVVLAAVAGIALSSLTIAFAVNNRGVLTDYSELKQANQVLQAQAQEASASAQAEADRLRREQDSLRQQITASESELTSLRSEVGELRRDKLTANQQVTTLQNQLSQLNETNRMLTELSERFSSEVNELRGTELALRQNEIDLLDRIADLQSNNEALTATVRGLREQMARMDREQGGGETGAGSADVTAYVMGQIVNTERDASGATLARVDLGSEDGLARGKRLFIIRNEGGNPRLVGHFNVRTADLQFAEGVVDTLGLELTPQRGDMVVSDIRR
jgi:archaellum component FlaC